MSLPNKPIEEILNDQGIDPEQELSNGNTAFAYLEACIMAALDEIEELQ